MGNDLRAAWNKFKRERWNVIGGVLLFIVIVAIVALSSGCSAKPAKAELVSKAAASDDSKYVLPLDTPFVVNIPAQVNGIVVDCLPRIEGRTSSELSVYRLTIEVNGVPGVYPVDAETWVKARIRTKYESGTIALDCDPLPCVKEGE